MQSGSACTSLTRGALWFALASLPSPPSYGSRPTGKAERHEFPPESGSVAAALCPTPLEIVAVRRKGTHPRRLAPERRTACAEPAPDRLALGVKLGGNVRDGGASRMQSCRLLVA